jgi:hypothetical protein
VAQWNTHCWVERFEAFIHHAAVVRRVIECLLWKRFPPPPNNDSTTVTQHVLQRHFDIGRNGKVPTRQTILNWVTQFKTTTSIVDKKPPGRPWTVRTPGNVRRVAHAFQRSPQLPAHRHSISLHLTPKKWLENVILFHVAYHCLASYDLIFI